MGRVAAYVRISRDDQGRAEGVADQEAACRRYVADRWPDATIVSYCDNDLSASSPKVRRPGFEALRAAIAAGGVDELVVVEQSRLTRSNAEWFTLAAELVAAGITTLHTTREGLIHVDDEIAGIKSVLNAAEVKRLRARVLDKHDALARDGRPWGGTAFGYRSARNGNGEATLEIVPEAAAAARWAADALLSGWSLSAVASRWNDEGIRTARGGKTWGESTVRRALTKPTIAGLRTHKGITRKGTWPAILDEQTWHALRALLEARNAARASGRARRKFLLTGGIARCGRCGAPLVAQTRTMGGKVKPYYQCQSPRRGGCSRIGIIAEPFEAHVVDTLVAELKKPAFFEAFAQDSHQERRDDLVQALAAVDARRGDLARRWARGDLTGDEWDAAKAELDRQQVELGAGLADIPPPVTTIDPQLITEGWAALELGERRQIVDMFIDSVTVAPAKPGKGRFDAGRISIEWRTT
jgi:site-specific DNA recombinase